MHFWTIVPIYIIIFSKFIIATNGISVKISEDVQECFVYETGDSLQGNVQLNAFRTSAAECRKAFNITLVVLANSFAKSIAVTFEPLLENSTLFKFYDVRLAKKGKECTSSEFCEVCTTQDYIESQTKVEFQNLTSGIYQVWVIPCINIISCCKYYFNSADQEISDVQLTSIFPIKTSKCTLRELLLVEILFIIAFAIYCFLYFWKRRPSGAVNLPHQNSFVEMCDIVPEEYDMSLSKKIQVFIMYPHDEETQTQIQILKDFLENCANFDVVLLDDEISEILVNPHHWLTTKLEYRCVNSRDGMSSSRKIIIIEPKKESHYSAGYDEIEESMFHAALNTLQSDWRKSLNDYCHLFVVNLKRSNFQSLQCSNLVPGARYAIPDHLIDLCLNMAGCKPENYDSLRKKLQQCLHGHEISKSCEVSNF